METKELIYAYTGITTETQGQLQFDTAYDWLAFALPEEPKTVEAIPLQPSFWAWWAVQWEAVDTAFIDNLKMDPKYGQLTARIPGSQYHMAIRSERHLALIWEDYHNVRYVHGDYMAKKGLLHTLKSTFKRAIK